MSRLTVTDEELADKNRAWTGEELFKLSNDQLRTILSARGIAFEGDWNKRTLVDAILPPKEGGKTQGHSAGRTAAGDVAEQNKDAADSTLGEDDGSDDEGDAFVVPPVVKQIIEEAVAAEFARLQVALGEQFAAVINDAVAGVEARLSEVEKKAFGKVKDTLFGAVDDLGRTPGFDDK